MAINEKRDGDCGYICLYNNDRVELYAKGLYEARQIAIQHFKVRECKKNNVYVYLAEKSDGSEYVHTAVD